MLKLQFVDRRQPAFWLVDPRLTIGRDKTNNLVINDEGISVFHAELQQEEGKLFLRDTGSVNGTFLNGEPVTKRTEVKVGDTIRLHLVELQVIDPTKAPPEPVAPPVKREMPKAAPLWQVKAMTGVISGRMFPIDGTNVIGRDPHCDIVVGGAHVSRRHAEFLIRNGALWVKDLGSSNGSFVNGKRYEEVALQNGDEVKFDAMIFKVVGPTEPVVHSDFEEEAERTQFRPVVNVPLAKTPKSVSPAPVNNRPTASAPVPKVTPAPAIEPSPVVNTNSSNDKSDSGSSMGVIVIAILILIILIAVYKLA
ncbi:MAG: FHA domain-containing protein [Moraxellaceae bacterium]|jgi:pSer/pThr/pTyr-binding forkhead associated (FHA) protein|nr:FHA domain-containing protein [Moraxellaceae bacterium]HQV79894.1 FHA domain-containing protein [Agitococcus sp.]MBK7299479.1 FHA domain-containing protein [Moraxellaceae bacterium]MBK9185313.1 FHA domain-containing protein [Moraxellaceae bacterium]MBL0229305.1 FHA domain-containing protein [Moraxellaceae bacterium]